MLLRRRPGNYVNSRWRSLPDRCGKRRRDGRGSHPRGFAGTGTGLFAGDNLNPSFPEGDGVQIFLTFELSGVAFDATSVVQAYDALVVVGSPFEDLGPLSTEVVSFDSFGPELFDTPALSDRAQCVRVDVAGVRCDVGNIASPFLMGGDTVVQFRLLFEQPADMDGQQDLAMFFRSDSNTNQPGLFTLTIDR